MVSRTEDSVVFERLTDLRDEPLRPRSRTWTTLALLAVVVLAGCAGAGPTTQTPTDSATATPSTGLTPTANGTGTTTGAVTETDTNNDADTTDDLAASRPPGVDEDGVGNLTKLVLAHRESVVATPGVVEGHTNVTRGNRTVVADTTAVATANLTRVRYESQATADSESGTMNKTTVLYGNETSVAQRVVLDGEVRLANVKNRSFLFDRALTGLATAQNPVRGLLKRGNFSVVGVEEIDGTSVVTLEAEGYNGGRLASAESVREYTATVRITENGLVLSASEEIVGTEDARLNYYEYAYSFTADSVDPEPLVIENTTTPTPRGS